MQSVKQHGELLTAVPAGPGPGANFFVNAFTDPDFFGQDVFGPQAGRIVPPVSNPTAGPPADPSVPSVKWYTHCINPGIPGFDLGLLYIGPGTVIQNAADGKSLQTYIVEYVSDNLIGGFFVAFLYLSHTLKGSGE